MSEHFTQKKTAFDSGKGRVEDEGRATEGKWKKDGRLNVKM